LLGFSPVFSATVFGATTAVMSIAGMFLGRVLGRLIRIRADLLSGVTLIIAAIVLPIAFGG
jgi:putative Mn2+ efflux pump MntP